MEPKENNKGLYAIIAGLYEIFIFFISCHIGKYQHRNPSAEFGEIMRNGIDNFREHPLSISFTVEGWKLFTILTFASAFCVFYYYVYHSARKKSMQGKEGGTAHWNTKIGEYNKTYTDPAQSKKAKLYPSENAIISNDIFLTLNTRQSQRNNNTLVIGGSGSGKSRFYVKPNILQANACYVCTDPAGELLASTGTFLENQGYTIKIFNLMQMSKSHKYNPFRYVHAEKEEEVLTMIDCLIENTTSANKKGGDQFWESAEKTLLRALCYYLIKNEKPADQNWSTVMFLLRQASVDEDHPDTESNLDKLFNEVAKNYEKKVIEAKQNGLTPPNEPIELTQYKSFKQGAGKTLKSILISCSVRLSVFDIEQLANLTNEDEMDLENMGMEKRAYFVITPQTTETFNFLVAMLYSQMFQTLYEVGGKLLDEGKFFNYEVRFLLDEFVNIGRIPQFDVKIATMRKYRISCAVILQTVSQLDNVYEKAAGAIIGNCDTKLFLGGDDKDTVEYLSEMLGTQTIRTGNLSVGSKKGGGSESFSYTNRKLMNPDELGHISNKKCIVNIRGLYPFFTRKFMYERHPNYKYTGDANKEYLYKNTINNMENSNKKLAVTGASASSMPQLSYFDIEKNIRLQLRKKAEGKLDEFSPQDLNTYLQKYGQMSDVNIFDEMSDISFKTELSSAERETVSNELARVILKTAKIDKARKIISAYKQKMSVPNGGLRETILDTVKQEAPEAIDEWTREFYGKK